MQIALKILIVLLAVALVAGSVLLVLHWRRTDAPPDDDLLIGDGTPEERAAAGRAADEARATLMTATSYREVLRTEFVFPLSGAQTTMITETDTRYYGIRDAEIFACLRETSEQIRQGGASERFTELSGYQDGKMFLADGERKLYSATDAQEYLDALGLLTESDRYLSELSGARAVRFRSRDGMRTVVIRGMSEERIGELEEKFSSLVPFVGNIRVRDAQTTVKIDPNGAPVESVVSVDFETAGVSLTVRTTYSEWNAVQKPAEPDFSTYRLTGDLLLIDRCAEALNTAMRRAQQTFSLRERITRRTSAEVSTENRELTASAGDTDGTYFYRIVENRGGVIFDRYYTGGTETTDITMSTGDPLPTRRDALTDAEAKQKIAALCNAGSFSTVEIGDVAVGDKNFFSFDSYAPDVSAYEDEFLEVSDAMASYAFTFGNEGELLCLIYTLTIDGFDADGALLLIIEQTVDFSDEA